MTVIASAGRQGRLPEGMPAEMPAYRWFAAAYGWPPGVVDELSLDAQEWLPLIEEAHGRVEQMRTAEANSAAHGGGQVQ